MFIYLIDSIINVENVDPTNKNLKNTFFMKK